MGVPVYAGIAWRTEQRRFKEQHMIRKHRLKAAGSFSLRFRESILLRYAQTHYLCFKHEYIVGRSHYGIWQTIVAMTYFGKARQMLPILVAVWSLPSYKPIGFGVANMRTR
jgi:hypothetical protein